VAIDRIYCFIGLITDMFVYYNLLNLIDGAYVLVERVLNITKVLIKISNILRIKI